MLVIPLLFIFWLDIAAAKEAAFLFSNWSVWGISKQIEDEMHHLYSVYYRKKSRIFLCLEVSICLLLKINMSSKLIWRSFFPL